MITRIDPPLPLITPKGKGVAHFLIDYGFEHDLMWVVFIDETGECWTFSNKEIKAQPNITAGRAKVDGYPLVMGVTYTTSNTQ
jgi:hypothetical protein